MDRVTQIFHDAPRMVGQTQGHHRCAAVQRAMNLDPVVDISEDPQRRAYPCVSSCA